MMTLARFDFQIGKEELKDSEQWKRPMNAFHPDGYWVGFSQVRRGKKSKE
jgi:hypothetical protein